MFNFPPLRAELQARGHTFRSRTDTETIVHLFEERGIECLHALRGMFALAIWDGRARELWLARDRRGKKSFYYFSDPSRLVFGSEIKCLLAYPGVPRALDASALPLYLTYSYVPAPDIMFEGIRMLRPGCRLRVANGGVEEREYWSPPSPSPVRETDGGGPGRGYAATLLGHLRETVRLRLISDVPLGAFLSGGLDSSAIVALMAEAASGPVKTFAIGFNGEPSYDETAHARAVAQRLGTDHHEFIVQRDAVDLVPKLAWHFDQPFGDSSAIPTYLVSKLAREHVTVALTGDGGDELFAGYDRFRAARLAQRYQRVPQPLHRALAALARRWPQSTGYADIGRRALRFVDAARRRRQIHSQASLCRPPAAGDHPPAQARLWRAGGQVVPHHPARLLARHCPLATGAGARPRAAPSCATIDRRTPLRRARPRPRAVDPVDAGGVGRNVS